MWEPQLLSDMKKSFAQLRVKQEFQKMFKEYLSRLFMTPESSIGSGFRSKIFGLILLIIETQGVSKRMCNKSDVQLKITLMVMKK